MTCAGTYTHTPIIDASFMNFNGIWINNESFFSNFFQTNDTIFFFRDSDIRLKNKDSLICKLFLIWHTMFLHWASPFPRHFWHKPWPSSDWVGSWSHWPRTQKHHFHHRSKKQSSHPELCPSLLLCPTVGWNSSVSKNYGFEVL